MLILKVCSLSHIRRGIIFSILNFVFSILVLVLLSGCKSSTEPVTSSGSGSLSGTVKAYGILSAQPVSSSGVEVELQATKYHAISDSLGNFRIDNIPAGVYNIIFSKQGFDSMIYPVHHLIGAGTDIINDAYLIQESNDSILFKIVSSVYTVSITKFIHIIDTLIKIGTGHNDTIIRSFDTTIITYDTARTPVKIITTCNLVGNLLPDNIYVYSSLDSGVFPNSICRETNNLTMDAWLTQHKNDTLFHAAFQSPKIINGVFLDTLSSDVIGRKPFSFESGQVIYIYACGHSSTNGLPLLDGEYKHFLTTPYGPQVVRYRFVVP